MRDRVIFAAGCAAGRRTLRRWQTAGAAAFILLGALWLIPLPHRGATPHDIATRQTPVTQAPIAATDKTRGAGLEPAEPVDLSYLRIRDQVLTDGLASLPIVQSNSAWNDAATAEQLRRELLGEKQEKPLRFHWSIPFDFGGQS
jgi:hypothetical protein